MTDLAHTAQIDPMNPADNKRTIDGFVIINAENKAKLAQARKERDDNRAKADEVQKKYKTSGYEVEMKFLEASIAASESVTRLSKITVDKISDNPREWTKADLITLGTQRFGVPVLDALAFLGMNAQEVVNGEYTPRAINAQKILAEYMPKTGNTGQDLIGFINAIGAANKATWNHPVRVKAHEKQPVAELINPKNKNTTGFQTGALFDVNKDIKINLLDDASFDQQAALAMLDSKGVKVSADQSLKTPQFEQAALAAVKSIKQSVAIAA